MLENFNPCVSIDFPPGDATCAHCVGECVQVVMANSRVALFCGAVYFQIK